MPSLISKRKMKRRNAKSEKGGAAGRTGYVAVCPECGYGLNNGHFGHPLRVQYSQKRVTCRSGHRIALV